MKKIVLLVPAAMAAALAVSAFAGAARNANSVTFAVKLTAKAEVPPQAWKNPGASGSFVGVVTGSKLRWTLKFAGLTGPASAALHLGAAGTSGPAVVSLCGPCYQPLKGASTLSKALLDDIKTQRLYVNVVTKKNPNGEIRGEL